MQGIFSPYSPETQNPYCHGSTRISIQPRNTEPILSWFYQDLHTAQKHRTHTVMVLPGSPYSPETQNPYCHGSTRISIQPRNTEPILSWFYQDLHTAQKHRTLTVMVLPGSPYSPETQNPYCHGSTRISIHPRNTEPILSWFYQDLHTAQKHRTHTVVVLPGSPYSPETQNPYCHGSTRISIQPRNTEPILSWFYQDLHTAQKHRTHTVVVLPGSPYSPETQNPYCHGSTRISIQPRNTEPILSWFYQDLHTSQKHRTHTVMVLPGSPYSPETQNPYCRGSTRISYSPETQNPYCRSSTRLLPMHRLNCLSSI